MNVTSQPTQPEATTYDSDEWHWLAVTQRDPQADGVFHYSVKTTGVYCRPACAARLALRKNVAFHDSCEAAEAAGFRPCKRYQPNGQASVQEYATKVAAACRAIEREEVIPRLDALAKTAAMSRFEKFIIEHRTMC